MEKRHVTVKDKNGNVLAIFSNDSSPSTEEAARNLMISPTIDIVQNGESTLSFQMLADSEKWNDIKNPENRYYCNGRVYTALNEQSIQYSGKIVNVTLVEEWYLLDRVFVQAHNVDTKIEAIDEHTVKILPKTSTEFKLTVNGTQYNDSDVKDSTGTVMPRGSAGYALWAILKGTDWKLGVCDVIVDGFDASKDYGTFNVESDMKDALYNIQMIQELYGGILVWDSENKTVSLRDETKSGTDFNTWKGFILKEGKNLQEHPNISWDNNLITRLYPLGNGNLNIKNVNNGKNYIDNFSYTNSIYVGYLQNSSIYDTNSESGQNCLLQWGKRQLEKYCKPRKTISYTIVDTSGSEDLDFVEPFDINDVVKAFYYDPDSKQQVSEDLRINHINLNWFFPSSSNTIEVGDKISNEVEVFYEVYKSTQTSAPTDSNGDLSSDDVYIEVPDYYWEYLDDYYGNPSGYGSSHGGYGSVSMSDMINLHVEKSVELDDGIATNAADITLVADDLKAQVSLEASHYEETSKGIMENKASITATADALHAQIDLEASHYEETKESIAGLQIYVDENYAKVTLLASYTTKNEFNQALQQNTASIQAWADATFAGIDLVTRTQGIDASDTGKINITPQMVGLYVDAGGSIAVQSGVTLRGDTTTIGSSYFYVNSRTDIVGERASINPDMLLLLGQRCYWEGGYLRGD